MAFEIVSFLSGAATAVFAEPLRRWIYRPVLKLEFTQADHFVAKTPERSGTSVYDAYYVRVKVTNRSRSVAKSCRAYLVNIERRGHSGLWEPTEYCESLQLAWSARGDAAYTAIDLPQEVPHFIDVLSTRAVSASFLPTLSLQLFRYERLFAMHGVYRFTILVSGDGVKPASLQVSFDWFGQWDKFNVAVA